MPRLSAEDRLLKELFPQRKVVLYEETEWEKNWGGNSRVSEWASDNAYEDLKHLDNERIVELAEEVLKAASPRRKSGLTEEQAEKLIEALRDYDPEIEEFTHMITDASHYAWELIYIPDKGDIESAIEKTVEEMSEDAFEQFHDMDMESLIEIAEERQPAVMKDLLQVSSDKETLLFDFWQSDFMKNLVASGEYLIPRGDREEQQFGVFEGGKLPSETYPHDHSVKVWNRQLDDLKSRFMYKFWKKLEKEAETDGNEYPDFDEQWGHMLKHESDAAAKAIRKVVGRG